MHTTVHSVTSLGLQPLAVDVQVTTTTGIPQVIIIGMVNTAIREAKDRIITALKNTGLKPKSRRTVISLIPADLKKTGSSYDLAMTVGILASYHQLRIDLNNSVLVGEVSLDGSVKRVEGCLAKVISARALGYGAIFIPQENLSECAIVQKIQIFGVEHIRDLLKSAVKPLLTPPKYSTPIHQLTTPTIVGQEYALRALTIAIAGHHHAHLVGPPGVGKTLISNRAQVLLPDLDRSSLEEVLALHSLHHSVLQTTPFRSPHHSISIRNMAGSLRSLTIGELSLAHHGILFLDELPEFKREVLLAIKDALDKKQVSLKDTNSEVDLPSRCLVLATSNPCPCGYWKTSVRQCQCSLAERNRYGNKLKGPLLERLDIHVQLQPLAASEYYQSPKVTDLTNEYQHILKARNIQKERYGDAKITNSDLKLETIKKYCSLDRQAKALLERALTQLSLSTRGYEKTIAISQTIADLDNAQSISSNHIAEALSYRFEQAWPKSR